MWLHLDSPRGHRFDKKFEIMSNPVVFFDITIGGKPAGRIEMTLRADVVPKAISHSMQTHCIDSLKRLFAALDGRELPRSLHRRKGHRFLRYSEPIPCAIVVNL